MKQFQLLLVKAAILAATSFCITLSGCGNSDISTVPVHGKVTMGGKPLPGGIITFIPDNIAAGLPKRPAQGAITTDGTYSLSTFHPDDGVVPGDYAVIISGPQAPEPFDRFTKAPPAAAGPKIPAIYSNAEKSPLKASISAGNSTVEKDFDLKQQ